MMQFRPLYPDRDNEGYLFDGLVFSGVTVHVHPLSQHRVSGDWYVYLGSNAMKIWVDLGKALRESKGMNRGATIGEIVTLFTSFLYL